MRKGYAEMNTANGLFCRYFTGEVSLLRALVEDFRQAEQSRDPGVLVR